jgi:hypothetical protein
LGVPTMCNWFFLRAALAGVGSSGA